MTTKWTPVSYGCRENPGVWDAGGGAMRYVDECAADPGIERVRIVSYCGRDYEDTLYYRLADTPGIFMTLAEAKKARYARACAQGSMVRA